MVTFGGPFWAVPELFSEGKQLIPALQQLLGSYFKMFWMGYNSAS